MIKKYKVKILLGIIIVLVGVMSYWRITEYKRVLYYDCYYNETVGPVTELYLKQRKDECKEQVNEQLNFFVPIEYKRSD